VKDILDINNMSDADLHFAEKGRQVFDVVNSRIRPLPEMRITKVHTPILPKEEKDDLMFYRTYRHKNRFFFAPAGALDDSDDSTKVQP